MVLHNWYFGFCSNNHEKIVHSKAKEKPNHFKFDISIDPFCWHLLFKCLAENWLAENKLRISALHLLKIISCCQRLFLLMLTKRIVASKALGPFTQIIVVRISVEFFDALVLQPAAISMQFTLDIVRISVYFDKPTFCLKVSALISQWHFYVNKEYNLHTSICNQSATEILYFS